jgi:hypothetical protein
LADKDEVVLSLAKVKTRKKKRDSRANTDDNGVTEDREARVQGAAKHLDKRTNVEAIRVIDLSY